MSRAAVLAAALLAAGPPAPASIAFGSVQLGKAARHIVRVRPLAFAVSGAGFSAARTRDGVLVVFEPYEPEEQATGALVLRLHSGLRRIPLRGRGVDTLPPIVTVQADTAARGDRALRIHFAATDNDLVVAFTVAVPGQPLRRLSWPASNVRWRVPRTFHGTARVTVTAVDRVGNRASATTTAQIR